MGDTIHMIGWEILLGTVLVVVLFLWVHSLSRRRGR
jgi:hypothetical protein